MSNLMPHLIYENPPKYKTYSSYRDYLRQKSNCSCNYCTITENESPGSTFHVDHFRPKTLFPKLEAECMNLRYSCPRCNSYKSDIWISEEEGCHRKCDECGHPICHDNIHRLIDTIIEDPSEALFIGEDDNIYAVDGSNPAIFTIRYLRLNRTYLIKLRRVRKFIEAWRLSLDEEYKKALALIEDITIQQQVFISSVNEMDKDSNKERTYIEIINTLYELMKSQVEQWALLIQSEMRKLDYLIDSKNGCAAI